MAGRDWRTKTPYKAVEDFTPRELAWEYLRRNPDFVRDQRRASKADADPDAAETVAQTWGLRFRRRPALRLATDGGILVTEPGPRRRHPDRRALRPHAPAA